MTGREVGTDMGRRPTPAREKLIAQMLANEVENRVWMLLRIATVSHLSHELSEPIGHYENAGGPEPTLNIPDGISDEERAALVAAFSARWEAWRCGRRDIQVQWLTRHVLDPNSTELLVPKEFAVATRTRLLAKARDTIRRVKGFRTIRIDAETAEWLDLLASRNGFGSRSETVEMMVQNVMESTAEATAATE